MAKLDKDETYEKNKIKATFKLVAILISLSIIFSLVFVKAIGKGRNSIAFSNNMFLAGTLLFGLSIIVNLVKSIFVFKNRKLFAKGNNKIEKIDGKTPAGNLSNEERKLLLRHELFVILFRSFLISGITSIIISVAFALLV